MNGNVWGCGGKHQNQLGQENTGSKKYPLLVIQQNGKKKLFRSGPEGLGCEKPAAKITGPQKDPASINGRIGEELLHVVCAVPLLLAHWEDWLTFWAVERRNRRQQQCFDLWELK